MGPDLAELRLRLTQLRRDIADAIQAYDDAEAADAELEVLEAYVDRMNALLRDLTATRRRIDVADGYRTPRAG